VELKVSTGGNKTNGCLEKGEIKSGAEGGKGIEGECGGQNRGLRKK